MKKVKFLAVLASFAVAASMLPMTVGAAGYAAIDGTKVTSFDKYLVMKNDANVPAVNFEFTIKAGDAVEATGDTMEVLAGVGTPKFVVEDDNANGTDEKAKVEFKSSDTTAAENTVSDKTVNFVTEDDTDEKFATKTVKVDFSDVEFTEPGVYRYIITEEDTTFSGVTNDSVGTRTLDVYVIDDSDTAKKLKIESYVLHTGTAAPKKTASTDPAKLEDKSTGFTNKFGTNSIEFGKEVTGNQGSKDKYFKFTLQLNGIAGSTFNVITDKMDVAPSANSATKYDADTMTAANGADDNDAIDGLQIFSESNNVITRDFYLSDGQYVRIEGLPTGIEYTLTEDKEEYTATEGTDTVWKAAAEAEEAKVYDDATSGTVTKDIHTGYTNDKRGTIPTGVILSVAAPVVIGVAVLGGIVFLFIRNKKRDAEEEE